MAVEFDKITNRDAFGNVVAELAEKNEDIMFLFGDTSSVGGKKIHNLFPKRALNVGIAEQNMTLMGAGMAACGAKVFVATYAVFAAMRMLEQVRTFVAYSDMDVKVIAGMGGISAGEEGVTHQGTEAVNIMRCIPNMVVVVPADAVSTEVITRAITEYVGPVYMSLGKNKFPKVFDDNYKFEIGKANIMEANGEDAAIICNGLVVSECIQAQQLLCEAGYGVKLIEMPCVKPIDRDAISWAAKECGLIITVEDNNIMGGLGGAVAEVLSETYEAKLCRMGLNDRFAESGNEFELLDKYGLRAAAIVDKVETMIKHRGSASMPMIDMPLEE